MRIILFVAGETICRRTFEEFIQMTLDTGNILVGLCEFKSRSVVVELGGDPALGRMA